MEISVKEAYDLSSANIIFLPPAQESEVEFASRYFPGFSSEHYLKNLAIVVDILNRARIDCEDEKLKATVALVEPIVDWLTRTGDYSGLANARPIKDELSLRIPGIQFPTNEKRISLDDLAVVVKQQFSDSSKQTILLSSSHVSTYAEILALNDMVQGKRVGVMVFDRHLDILPSSTTGEARKPAKNNVFLSLIQEQRVTAVSFVGCSKREREECFKLGAIYPDRAVWMVRAVRRHPDRFDFSDESVYLEGEHFNNKAFQEEVKRQIAFLKNAGVTNVVLSIDPDVLRSQIFGYSATDYSAVNLAISLGIQDFPETNNITDKQVRAEQEIKILGSMGKLTYLREDLRRQIGIGDRVVENAKLIIGYGLSLGAIGQAVDVAEESIPQLGMELGVRLPNGGRYLGDIVELSAPDYRGRTAKAVEVLIRRILKDKI